MKRLLTCILAGMATLAHAADLPGADPASVGLDSERFAAVTRLLPADPDRHVLPGAVLLIARHGKAAYGEAIGSRDPQAPKPATRHDIYRIYSMSKPITVAAALMLLERGQITLDGTVAKYLPQFASMQVGVPDGAGGTNLVRVERPVTIRDLMRHSAGLNDGVFGSSPVKSAYVAAHPDAGDPATAAFVNRLAKLPLAYQPGTTWDHSYAIDVLGRLVNVVSGRTRCAFEKQNLLDPLGMADTGFGIGNPAEQGRTAAPFADDRSFGVDAAFGDPRKPPRMQSGGGGIVSTAEGYARFLQMMLNGGSLDGRRYLGPQTVRFMMADQIGPVRPGLL